MAALISRPLFSFAKIQEDRRPTEGAAMKQRAFRQVKTGYVLLKKARPRQRGQAATNMHYTM